MAISGWLIPKGFLDEPIDNFWCSAYTPFRREPWPHYVHYRAPEKPFYCPPDKFWFMYRCGPSDCDWMVPGTGEC